MTDIPDAAAASRAWTIEDAEERYGLRAWGGGCFRVSDDGHLLVAPRGDDDPSAIIDLYEVVQGLDQRGLATPVLVRLPDLLRKRLGDIRSAFDDAIRGNEFRGGYSCVYPIKVNQQRQLVETIREIGAELGFGLEAGSKPELLAVLGLTRDQHATPIVCNGFKDDEYIETVVLAQKLGRVIYPVIESFGELERLLRHASRYGIRPRIGIRLKPSTAGVGKWAESGGERSKFGLHAPELLAALELLKSRGMADCLKLVHFHVGSQMCDIRQVKTAVSELARVYCELRRLGAGVEVIDIGGGLAVDYDGSNSTWASSMNYSLEEYANDVVYRIGAACNEAGQPHPLIISESGRAMVANSSILIFDILGRTRFRTDPGLAWARGLIAEEETEGRDVPQPVKDLVETWESLIGSPDIAESNLVEAFHDAQQAREEALNLFRLGYLSLPMRAVAERFYWAIGKRAVAISEERNDGGPLPDQLTDLPEHFSDIYFGNFSLFQSLPDSWAIDQVFPVVPLHRLDEKPTRRAIIADITCDSDGKIDRFACTDQRDYAPTLDVHELRVANDGTPTEPYLLGIFLVGAYQEVLGDLHNLFGDTHAVHVALDEDAGWRIDDVIEGDTVRDVLRYVQFNPDELRRSIRQEVEAAVRKNRMSVAESQSLLRFYESGLEGYTYLE
ncbi:MAG: arginine decarboxylase [Phycisphaerae bacterium]|nr:arginine decarboxylase [Phycisphaerae bacterium]